MGWARSRDPAVGAAEKATGRAAFGLHELYARRFPAYRPEDLSGYSCYLFRPHRLKVFDERALGEGIFVTAAVLAGGRLDVEHVENYRPQV